MDKTAYPIIRPLVAMPGEWEERVAFSSPLGKVRFRELRDRMLRFAGWLKREAGVGPSDRVAFCLPKSLEAVVAIHGILAAGAAYVGLQHRGPAARVAAILAATQPRLLLASTDMTRRLASEGGPGTPAALEIEELPDGHGIDRLLGSASPLPDATSVLPDALAAIVLTSGSTGEPKGVMRSHRNMVANGDWHVRTDEIGPGDVRLGNMGMHYLASYLFFPAAAGCRVHLLPDEEVMFPELVADALERERASVWSSPTTALRLLMERGDLARRNVASLRVVKSYGEPLSIELLQKILAALPQVRVRTSYGSTEAPNITAYDVPRPFPAEMGDVPLGEVQEGYVMRLCDETGRSVPQGEIGEICASGPAVALGYWNDPVMTSARRLNGQPDSHRTGDLAYYDDSGLLHFAGRRDRLIKLRGHRFDLGEIEAALRRHAAVREAVALLVQRSDGTTEIFTAVEAVARQGLEGEISRISAERLPRYAWPARILILSELPRLPGGKVDRVKLQGLADEFGAAPAAQPGKT